MKPEKTAAPGFLYFHVTSTFTIHVKYSKMSSSVQPPQEPNQPRILTERSSSTLHHNKSSRQTTSRGDGRALSFRIPAPAPKSEQAALPGWSRSQTQQAAYERKKLVWLYLTKSVGPSALVLQQMKQKHASKLRIQPLASTGRNRTRNNEENKLLSKEFWPRRTQ